MTRSRDTIVLPWTAPPLSMNDRGMTRGAAMAKATKVRLIRDDVYWLLRSAQLPKARHVTVQLHYRPRDARRRDTDNLTATLKPICDAIAAGTERDPGYGMVPDDTPEYMAKPEPIIHPAEKGKPGTMWLVLTIEEA